MSSELARASAEFKRRAIAALRNMPVPGAKRVRLDEAAAAAAAAEESYEAQLDRLRRGMNESQLYAVQSALARIIDHLKRGWIGIPFAELLEKAQVNDLSDEQIEVVRLRLATNPKVISEQKARAFRYKPKYAVRDKKETLQLLREMYNAHRGSVLLSALDESFEGVEAAVRELADERLVTIIDLPRDKAILYRDPEFHPDIDTELRDQWRKAKISETIDVAGLLKKKGLSTMNMTARHTQQQQQERRRKARANPRAKITNTHMTQAQSGDDLTMAL